MHDYTSRSADWAGMGKLFLLFWAALHIVGFGLSIVHYQMKDNLTGARAAFGITFGQLDPLTTSGRKLTQVAIARGSAQMLHSKP